MKVPKNTKQMGQKHTPGPWHSGCFVGKEKDGCKCTWITSETMCGSVCTISVWNGINGIQNGDNDCPRLDEAIANSKLIAAAPDLLEVLIEYVEESKKHIPIHSKAAFIQLKAESIIKKATE